MTDLSPAANAVWEAFNLEEAGVFVDYGDKLAAALRALAVRIKADTADVIRQDVLDIADELEGATTTSENN
jgi:hypothetical protein